MEKMPITKDGLKKLKAELLYLQKTEKPNNIQAIAEAPDKLGFIVPGEGSEIWLDSMCIPAKAPNPDAAHKWINWILDPKVGAELSNYNHFATPNEAAMPHIAKEDLDNPGVWPTPEIMKTLVFTKDLGKDNRIMDEAWTRAKSH